MHRSLFLSCLVALCAGSPALAGSTWHFTVTADIRANVNMFASTLDAVNSLAGGPGAFHVTVGDLDMTIAGNLALLDRKFGASTVWYPVIGNHERETPSDVDWLRNEYLTGNGVRTPLKDDTLQNGPVGSAETTYSWDYGDAHFVVLNEYWNGETAPGSDRLLYGDIVPALRDWLVEDLTANTKPYVFVFGHEPAFPTERHVGNSLDEDPAHRDAFWNVLEQFDVEAFISGHTHVYSRHQGDKNGVGDTWQIVNGAAGQEAIANFLDITISDAGVRYDVYDNRWGSFALLDTWTAPAVSAPEPATLAVLAVGLVGILRARRRG